MPPRKKKTTPAALTAVPVYVVHGKDRRCLTDTVHQITQDVLAGADPQVALSVYDGPATALSDVLDALRTLPFLSPRRVVVVNEADPFITRYRSQLEQYLQEPSTTGVLILAAESFPANTRLAKVTARIGRSINCDPPSRRQLPAYLSEYARDNHRLELSAQAAALLVELGGDEPGPLRAEIDKIAAYVGNPPGKDRQITVDHVAAVVGNNRSYNVFNVIDALISGRTSAALEHLQQMLQQDRNASYTAVGAFAWHFRRLYRARLLADQGTPSREIIRQLRIWSQPERFLQQVKRLDLPRIGDLLCQLTQVDFAAKSGRGTVQTGLEKLIVRFAPAA